LVHLLQQRIVRRGLAYKFCRLTPPASSIIILHLSATKISSDKHITSLQNHQTICKKRNPHPILLQAVAFNHVARSIPGTHRRSRPIPGRDVALGEGPAINYLCGDCNSKVSLKRGDPIRCKECGHRVLYKERTKRMVQFEAR